MYMNIDIEAFSIARTMEILNTFFYRWISGYAFHLLNNVFFFFPKEIFLSKVQKKSLAAFHTGTIPENPYCKVK